MLPVILHWWNAGVCYSVVADNSPLQTVKATKTEVSEKVNGVIVIAVSRTVSAASWKVPQQNINT